MQFDGGKHSGVGASGLAKNEGERLKKALPPPSYDLDEDEADFNPSPFPPKKKSSPSRLFPKKSTTPKELKKKFSIFSREPTKRGTARSSTGQGRSESPPTPNLATYEVSLAATLSGSKKRKSRKQSPSWGGAKNLSFNAILSDSDDDVKKN
jgi:hypothetical protein